MCGICGVFDFKGEPVDRALLGQMMAALRHRGPDGEGRYVDTFVGLGHRRLSIIDVDGGAQPITNEDGTVQVVFNGEIYNFIELREELIEKGHRFATRSDTEVIAHAYEQWGTDCVARFNGIFAFALWDGVTQTLLLARDHLGVKPLYYAVVEGRLLFASEIKSILIDPATPRQVNLRGLEQLFSLRYVPSPDTLFSGIRKLPPAHRMVVTPAGMQIQSFWNWTPRIDEDTTEDEQVEKYRSLVEDAVRLQMRSDVPVGLFLSSGVDSGAILALMRQHTASPIHTFTIGFEEGGGRNETEDARRLATHFGADHDELIIGPQDYQKYYERYLWDLEEPVGNESAVAFYFVSWLASQKVKVALTGQGADEPWAGYPRYVGVKLSDTYSRLPQFLTDGVLRRVFEPLVRNEKLKRGLQSLHERDVLSRFVRIYSFYSPAMKNRLFLPWVKDAISTNGDGAKEALRRLQAEVSDLDPLTQMLYIDTRANLPDDLLMVGDKTGMANSVEVRVPFLDYRLIEFIETLPPDLKLRGFKGKYLHKRAIEKWLDPAVVHRKKKGFANPVDRWLRGRMRTYVDEYLLSDGAAIRRYFDQGYVRQLVTQHQSNRQDHMRHINLLISFELWHRQFMRA